MKTATVTLLVVVLLSVGCTGTLNPTALGKIRVEPEVGTSLRGTEGAGTYHWGYEAGEPTNITLMDIDLSIRPCDKEYSTHLVSHNTDLEVGDPCLVVSGHVESHEAKMRQVAMFACGFDEDGEFVAETLDSDASYGCIMFDMEPGETREFLLHVNPSDRIRTIRVFGSAYKEEPTEPSTPVPESEMVHLIFSRAWILENDQNPSEGTVTITFPESWLREPPTIAEADDAVELTVPLRLLMDHNTSKNPDEIAVTFPDYYFDGL